MRELDHADFRAVVLLFADYGFEEFSEVDAVVATGNSQRTVKRRIRSLLRQGYLAEQNDRYHFCSDADLSVIKKMDSAVNPRESGAHDNVVDNLDIESGKTAVNPRESGAHDNVVDNPDIEKKEKDESFPNEYILTPSKQKNKKTLKNSIRGILEKNPMEILAEKNSAIPVCRPEDSNQETLEEVTKSDEPIDETPKVLSNVMGSEDPSGMDRAEFLQTALATWGFESGPNFIYQVNMKLSCSDLDDCQHRAYLVDQLAQLSQKVEEGDINRRYAQSLIASDKSIQWFLERRRKGQTSRAANSIDPDVETDEQGNPIRHPTEEDVEMVDTFSEDEQDLLNFG